MYQKPLKIVFALSYLKKDGTDACVYKQFFMEIQDMYYDYFPVYTYGLRKGNAVLSVAVLPSNCGFMRLPDLASSCSAEVWEIIKALDETQRLDAILLLLTHFHVCKFYTIRSLTIP